MAYVICAAIILTAMGYVLKKAFIDYYEAAVSPGRYYGGH